MRACSTVMAIGSKPCSSMTSLSDAARGSASGHLPRRTLLAISQAVTALTQAIVSSAVTTSRARCENLSSPARNQTNAWLSKRTLIATLPQSQFFFWQRVKKERVRDVEFAFQRPELWAPLRVGDGLQSNHRVLSTRNNDFFARLGARDQFGERCFGFMNRDNR